MNISENTIKSITTPSNYRLGQELYDNGEVEIIETTASHILAQVGGKDTQHRKVELVDTPDGLSWKCTCRAAEKRVFCKHCVAAGLEAIHKNGGSQKIIGQTKNIGFEIGVRRTFDIPVIRAWEIITSDEGVKIWLGDVSNLKWENGKTYKTKEGTEGEIRAINPGSHLRITWWPKNWEKASTIQIRVIPNGEKTTISFHQENLKGAQEREEMRQRWEKVLDELKKLLK